MLDKHFCLQQTKNVFETFQKHGQVKRACQAMFVVVAKRASMLDKQSLKCLPSNVCLFGQVLKLNRVQPFLFFKCFMIHSLGTKTIFYHYFQDNFVWGNYMGSYKI